MLALIHVYFCMQIVRLLRLDLAARYPFVARIALRCLHTFAANGNGEHHFALAADLPPAALLRQSACCLSCCDR